MIPFEPQLFGTAANNGQMIAEVSASHKTAEMFRQLAQVLTGRAEAKRARGSLLTPLLSKLTARGRAESRSEYESCSVSVAHLRSSRAGARRRVRRRPQRRRRCSRRQPAAEDTTAEAGRAPFPSEGLGAPLVSAPSPTRQPAAVNMPAIDSRRSEAYYETKGVIFGALIEAIDLAQLARLDADSAREEIRDIVNEIIAIKNIVMSISEQEELLDDICNDVLGFGPLEPLLSRDDIADIMVNGSGTVYIEVLRQDPEDRHPLPRQPAAAEHLPAHRQPDRPPRRRKLADLRRAPARRQPRQRASCRRWRSTAPRSPSASSRRTS